MEKNCLARFYNVSVADDNLPVINTLFFDYPGFSIQDVVLNIAISTGETPVHINLARGMHYNGYAGELVTDVTVAANTSIRLTSKTQDLGNDFISDFFKISGGIYDLNVLSCYGYGDISCLDCSPNFHNGIESMKYAPNLVTFGGMNVDYNMLPSSLRYLVIGTNDGTNVVYIDNIPTTVQKVSTSRLVTASVAAQLIELTEGVKLLSGLRIVDGRLKGMLTNLPKGVKVISKESSLLTGDLNDFASMSGQDNSGCIAIKNPTNGWNITQGGIKITSIDIPVINNYSYFTWNNGTYEWASAQPVDMEKYITAASQTPLNFVPIVE
jgi:hypothetical protein